MAMVDGYTLGGKYKLAVYPGTASVQGQMAIADAWPGAFVTVHDWIQRGTTWWAKVTWEYSPGWVVGKWTPEPDQSWGYMIWNDNWSYWGTWNA